MNISVEISMYPLHEEYKAKIKQFIEQLNENDDQIEVRSSNMSTRLFGEYDSVTQLLNRCMKASMQQYGKIVFVCKYIEGDARNLKGYD